MINDPQLAEVCYDRRCSSTNLLRGPDGRLRVFSMPVTNLAGHITAYSESYSCAAHQPRVLVFGDIGAKLEPDVGRPDRRN